MTEDDGTSENSHQTTPITTADADNDGGDQLLPSSFDYGQLYEISNKANGGIDKNFSYVILMTWPTKQRKELQSRKERLPTGG